MIGVDFGIFLLTGFPIRSLKYRGGSSHERAGWGINSTKEDKKETTLRLFHISCVPQNHGGTFHDTQLLRLKKKGMKIDNHTRPHSFTSDMLLMRNEFNRLSYKHSEHH